MMYTEAQAQDYDVEDPTPLWVRFVVLVLLLSFAIGMESLRVAINKKEPAPTTHERTAPR